MRPVGPASEPRPTPPRVAARHVLIAAPAEDAGVALDDPERYVAADLVELRLDLLRDDVAPRAFAARLGLPVLVTLRSRGEGGSFGGTPREAAARLLAASEGLPSGSWVDAEGPVLATGLLAPLAARGVPCLASQHGGGAVALPTRGVAAWKVARAVTDGPSLVAAIGEARALAAGASRGDHPPAFVVTTGPLGVGARVVTAAIATDAGIVPFVYGLPDDADPALAARLPHVPRLSLLRDELRLGEVTGDARRFGLVGRPPSRSPSPRLHNAAFRQLGLDAVYLPEADLDAAGALALPYDGWSVTTPLKEAVAARCDEVGAVARGAGAVNTVRRRADGRLVGSNTDALAVARLALHPWTGPYGIADAGAAPPSRARGVAVVLGGGGFARAAAVGLRDVGFWPRLLGSARARATAEAVGATYGGPGLVVRGDEEVVVNATPVGADGALPGAFVDYLAGLPARCAVVDGPYGRDGRAGAFAVAARARGLVTSDGFALLVLQASHQVRALTGSEAWTQVTLEHALRVRESLVLVGPRAAGKTSVGLAVAARLGRPFVDTDGEIARRVGLPAGAVLASRGEPAFRDLEEREVARALARRGAVIALGGGALEREASVARLARSGAFVVRSLVAPEESVRRMRADPTPRPPLAPGKDPVQEARDVAARREAVWARCAHASVATDGRPVDEVAEAVAALWLARARASDSPA